jgi:GTPase
MDKTRNNMKAGFVNIFGKPNAGKSTLFNALMGEKLAITSHKAQTTRHRIKAFLNGDDYQIIFSDTPGVITEEAYKLHNRMMGSVKTAMKDADVAVLIVDVTKDLVENHEVFTNLRIKVPAIVILNKVDKAKPKVLEDAIHYFSKAKYATHVIALSALKKDGIEEFIKTIVSLLPEGEAFYPDDELTDLPTKFFVSELIREQIFHFASEEVPYHSTVLVNAFEQKSTLIKIQADIIVQRDTQKSILLGQGGKMIKQIGTQARIGIEEFLQTKVFLELFVKVRPKWRDNNLHLKEYGY